MSNFIVALFVRGSDCFYVGSVGDSCAVLGSWSDSENATIKAERVTPLDSLTNPVELDRLSKAHATFQKYGVYRAGRRINMTRALGDFEFKAPRTENGIDWLSPEPHVQRINLVSKKDEFLVLASDGLWNVFNEDSVVRSVQDAFSRNYDVERIAIHLATSACRAASNADNTTVMIVAFGWDITEDVASNGIAIR